MQQTTIRLLHSPSVSNAESEAGRFRLPRRNEVREAPARGGLPEKHPGNDLLEPLNVGFPGNREDLALADRAPQEDALVPKALLEGHREARHPVEREGHGVVQDDAKRALREEGEIDESVSECLGLKGLLISLSIPLSGGEMKGICVERKGRRTLPPYDRDSAVWTGTKTCVAEGETKRWEKMQIGERGCVFLRRASELLQECPSP